MLRVKTPNWSAVWLIYSAVWGGIVNVMLDSYQAALISSSLVKELQFLSMAIFGMDGNSRNGRISLPLIGVPRLKQIGKETSVTSENCAEWAGKWLGYGAIRSRGMNILVYVGLKKYFLVQDTPNRFFWARSSVFPRILLFFSNT
jgi:energy-converting hydrogenase Eha subunit A